MVGMRTRGVPAAIGGLWIILGMAILGLAYYALTHTAYPGLWWGGLTLSMVLLLTGAVWLLAALTGWVTWTRRDPAAVRVRD